MYLSRATLAGTMGLFCLRFSSCKIGPQNKCSTSDKNVDVAMFYTGSALLPAIGNNSVTLQGGDSYDSTGLAQRVTTHMDNEAFRY